MGEPPEEEPPTYSTTVPAGQVLGSLVIKVGDYLVSKWEFAFKRAIDVTASGWLQGGEWTASPEGGYFGGRSQ